MVKYGEGFIVTMALTIMAGLVFIAACFAKPDNQMVIAIVGIMGTVLAAVTSSWLPSRGQTSSSPSWISEGVTTLGQAKPYKKESTKN